MFRWQIHQLLDANDILVVIKVYGSECPGLAVGLV